MTAATATAALPNGLTTGQMPRYSTMWLLFGSFGVSAVVFLLLAASGLLPGFNLVGTAVVGTILTGASIYSVSRAVEGGRKAKDRLVTVVVTTAFVIALIPLISVTLTVVLNGAARFDIEFFTASMRNVVGAGGGALHAIVGTLLITGMATIISVPVGILTSIYLVEYGRGALARAVTFFVDVMTGIPSIVAGLFAYALFALITNDPGIRFGFGGAVALSVLMIPVVVRSTEEMLKLVPNELREASYALGVPKWLTVVKVVLPTAIGGIITGVMISIARVIGETAPLLIIAGFTTSINWDLFSERMMTLPVFVYNQYASQGTDAQAYLDRAWAGALVLILIVAILNIFARLASRWLSPKAAR